MRLTSGRKALTRCARFVGKEAETEDAYQQQGSPKKRSEKYLLSRIKITIRTGTWLGPELNYRFTRGALNLQLHYLQ